MLGKSIAIFAKLLVGGVLVVWLLSRVNTTALTQVLVTADAGKVLAAVAGLVLTVSLNAIRWRVILSQLGGRVSLQTAMAGTFEGMFFNLFLPTNVGGDAARAYRAYDVGVPAGLAVGSGLADRAVGLATVMALLLVASFVAPGTSQLPSFWIVSAVSACGLVAAVVLAAVGKALLPSAKWPPLKLVVRALDAFATIIFSTRLLTSVLPITVIANFANCIVLWSCARSVGLNVSFLDAVVVLEASSLAAILPISIGGWGLREGATAAILSAIGNPMTSSVAASLLYAGILVTVGALGAAVWVTNPYRRRLRLRMAGNAHDRAAEGQSTDNAVVDVSDSRG